MLRQAADVHFDAEAHPAYARILSELVPDEGRILRLLAIERAPGLGRRARLQPDRRRHRSSIAPGLNMIGAQAGLPPSRPSRRLPQQPLPAGPDLRSREEPLEDPIAYQVLEAQPEVMEAIKETTRAKTVQRSIRLTPFGEDFCRVCLPLDDAPDASAGAPAQLPAGDSEPEQSQNGRPQDGNGHLA